MHTANRITTCMRAIFFVGLTIVMALGALLLSGSRAPLRLRSGWTRACLSAMARLCGVEIICDGQTRALLGDGAPRLILANHISYLDIVVIGALAPARFLAKREVGQWPLVGWSARSVGALFVSRDSLCDRVGAIHRIRDVLARQSVCVFPEGSTTSALAPSKALWRRGQVHGALAQSREIVCVGMHYENQDAVCWIDDMAFLPHLARFFTRRTTRVFVSATVLAPRADAQASQVSALAHATIAHLCERAHALKFRTQVRFAPVSATAITPSDMSMPVGVQECIRN